MPYTPGDFWRICDLSGKKVLASQTRKTWDGLIVWAPLWYPKHPQLSIKGIPDRQNVPEPRPRPTDLSISPLYGWGSFCLRSLNGTLWTFAIEDDGALVAHNASWGTPQSYLILSGHKFTVDNDGALHVASIQSSYSGPYWKMYSPSGYVYEMKVDTDLAVLMRLTYSPATGVADTAGHFWFTPVIITETVQSIRKDIPYDSEGSVTQSGEEVWMET